MPAPPTSSSQAYDGNVGGEGDYRLFELGVGSRGDEWRIAPAGTLGPFVVVLLDADRNLLMRTYMSYSRSLRHVLRADTDQVYLGVIQNRSIEIDGYKWPIDTLIVATSNNTTPVRRTSRFQGASLRVKK